MIEQLARSAWAALYAQLSQRPILALTVSYVGAQFVVAVIAAYNSEKQRIANVISETVTSLQERSDEIEERIARANVEEQAASYDPTLWGEVPTHD